MNNNSINRIIVSLAISTIIVACNVGNDKENLKSEVDSSDLAKYKKMLAYASAQTNQDKSAINRASSDTHHQAFTVPAGTTLTFLKMRVTLFSSTNCQFGTELGLVEMNGGSNGVQFPAGTYTSTDASNFALKNRFDPVAESSSLSIRFDYRYESSTDTYGAVDAGWVSAACIPSPGFGDYDSNPPTDCVSGGACGLFNPQVAVLPSTYRSVVYVTAMKTDGNIKATAQALPTHPYITIGITGADYICNYDANKPSRSAGATFKAALFPQSVSPQKRGIYYYDSSYERLIAHSMESSNFLMGYLVSYPATWAYGGSNNMDHSIAEYGSDDPWIGGWNSNRDTFLGCADNSSPWTSASSDLSGITGDTSLRRIKTDGDGYDSIYWNASSTAGCNTLHKLVCVQQND